MFALKHTLVLVVAMVCGAALADVSHLSAAELAGHRRHGYQPQAEEEGSTPPPPPRPYAFSYTAGRFPGHYDRTHSEASDGSGTVRGSYSYVDPRQQVRTVQYVADENGFHPALSHPAPAETVAVAQARDRHYSLYNQIARDHADHPHPLAAGVPSQSHDTEAVLVAKAKHHELYEKIAAEHAAIGAQREAERRALGLPPAEPEHYDYQDEAYSQHLH